MFRCVRSTWMIPSKAKLKLSSEVCGAALGHALHRASFASISAPWS